MIRPLLATLIEIGTGFLGRVSTYFSRDKNLVSYWSLKKLEKSERYRHASIDLLSRRIELNDPYWFLYCYREIFDNEIYLFDSENDCPYIIDCGANIGLSVIYFKYRYPGARILAFEPDPEIFGILEKNLSRFDYDHIEIHQKAVWSSETVMSFKPDGSVGGRLLLDETDEVGYEVPTIRLRNYLGRPVDLLKLDIEGAEYDVLLDCKDSLQDVKRLFVEYHGHAHRRQILAEILTLLSRAGYRYHIRESYPILHPFIEVERERRPYDLILNIFAYRELAK